MRDFVSTMTGYTPGSTVALAATTNMPAPAGGDCETLVLSLWLTSLGYTWTSTTTNASMVATLRASALTQSH